MSRAKEAPNSKRHASQQSLNGAVKSIWDIMRRSNCAGALQYVPELTWMLFRRVSSGEFTAGYCVRRFPESDIVSLRTDC